MFGDSTDIGNLLMDWNKKFSYIYANNSICQVNYPNLRVNFMNTTNLIVEFLVIGIQVALWMTMLFLMIFGVNSFQAAKVENSGTLITAALIAVSYPIGIVIDNLADLLLKWKDYEIRRSENITDESQAIIRVRMFAEGDSLLAKQLEYQRTRIRLSRSTFINFILISLLSPYLVYFRLNNDNVLLKNPDCVAGFLFIFSAFIALGSYITWQDITRKYYKRFCEADQYLNINNQSLNK